MGDVSRISDKLITFTEVLMFSEVLLGMGKKDRIRIPGPEYSGTQVKFYEFISTWRFHEQR